MVGYYVSQFVERQFGQLSAKGIFTLLGD